MNKAPIGPSLSTELAGANELMQAAGTAQAATNAAGDPPMVGFGAGVHQYLNQLLTILYSKTTTLLAANMVLVSLLLSTRTTIKIAMNNFYIGAVFFFSLSAILSTIVLFPRFRHDEGGGLIFWRAILAESAAASYYKKVQDLTKEKVEEEYAKDNYHLAKVIKLKDSLLRGAIVFFILGLGCAVIGVVWPIIASHL